MRNKSRKRILHEQRVEIEKLRRELSAYARKREIKQEYTPQKLEIARYLEPHLPPLMLEDVKKKIEAEAVREIVNAVISGGVIEKTETRESGFHKISYTLRVLKKRY